MSLPPKDHSLKDVLHNAKTDVRVDAEEVRAEWHEQLADDKAQVKSDVVRDKQQLEKVAEDVKHPENLVQAVEGKLKQVGAVAEEVAADVAHPNRVAHAVQQKAAERKAALDKQTAGVAADLTGAIDKQRLPLILKIFGVLLILASAAALPGLIKTTLLGIKTFAQNGLADYGLSTVVVAGLYMVVLVVLALTFIVFGIRLLRNQRRFAALISYGLYVLLVAAALCSIMLEGIGTDLIQYGVVLVIIIALQSYLDPSLVEERRKHREERQQLVHEQGEAGTLGRDITGKGYITLNFFNLFWIFVVASIFGLFMEEIFHFLVVVPGQWQDRAGLLFGPFSPIYGCGAVLMTVFLNRFHKSNFILIFFVAAIIGGAFEYCVSLFMQYAFGAVAWDYTGMWLSIGGRTCGVFMCMWGLLGVLWIKLALPFLLRLVNMIPWNWRYVITSVCAALMMVDAVMTLQSLDCWYERLSGNPINTPIEKFYDQHFDNAYMENRFQSMTIVPDDAVRHK